MASEDNIPLPISSPSVIFSNPELVAKSTSGGSLICLRHDAGGACRSD
jgi:hypothetical protein